MLRALLAALSLGALALMLIVCGGIARAPTHDWHHPELDSWYEGLQSKKPNAGEFGGGISCCNKRDCHTTEAELRGTDWWARLGTHVMAMDAKGVSQWTGEWKLEAWVKIPADVVLQHKDNPTGEAVICHGITWNQDGSLSDKSYVRCFVPPTES